MNRGKDTIVMGVKQRKVGDHNKCKVNTFTEQHLIKIMGISYGGPCQLDKWKQLWFLVDNFKDNIVSKVSELQKKLRCFGTGSYICGGVQEK